MANFVLVHGGAHGAWCWDRLVPPLEAGAGVDSVTAIDLPGHGARLHDKPLEQITRADYVAAVIGDIESRGLRDVILVGHSLAGITLPEVAMRMADRMRRLIYLSTTNPPAGKSVNDMMQHPLSPLSRGMDFERMFCNDLDGETARWLRANLGPEPEGPMAEPMPDIRLPDSVPSTYILLERDEALPPEYQREQARNAGADEIVTFDAGHSAFASRPGALAELLSRYA